MFKWHQENYFTANADKCHLFLSAFSNKEITIANYNIASSNSEVLFGVVVDSEVTFAKHIENLCRKTNQKLHASARVANIMTLERRHLVMKTFFSSLITVLLYGCFIVENLITNLIYYKKGIYALYTTFHKLLEKDKSVTIQSRNLQYLATEIFKVRIGISPVIMTEMFKFCDNATHNGSSSRTQI